MKIAFGVCSLGIGHATRSSPIISKLVDEGHDVVLVSYGRAAQLLRREFPDLKMYEIPDFPIEYPEKAHQFIPYFFTHSNRIIEAMIKSHKTFLRVHEKEGFHMAISDSRFDVFHRKIPSFLIIHQLRIMVPVRTFRFGTQLYNKYVSRFYNKLIVPDFREDSLSGRMSHDLLLIKDSQIEYVGPLSTFRRRDVERDINVLVSISGPEPQRTLFERKVLDALDDLDGKIVVTLGRPELNGKKYRENVYHFVDAREREMLMNRAKLTISRSGYSTIMDLYVVGGKAMFVPTPGQPEQEYLAKYLESKRIAGYAEQENLNLQELINKSSNYSGFKGGYDPSRSVENVMRVVFQWS